MTYFYKRQASYQFNRQSDRFTEEITDTTMRNIEKAQQIIYSYFLEMIKYSAAEEILNHFDNLFIKYEDVTNSKAYNALGEIIFYDKEEEFKNTLLRCCYILNNNWVINNNINACKQLVDLFLSDSIDVPTRIYKLQRLRNWLQDFVDSEQYQTLRSLSGGGGIRQSKNQWSDRFSSYLLISQYCDPTKSLEQRQCAKNLSRKIKKQFKFDLAMYTAKIDSQSSANSQHKNPTSLGDGVLTLIKTILNKQGEHNYRNIAKRFFEQVHNMDFREFKEELIRYLGISQGDSEISKILQRSVIQKLNKFQEHHNDEQITLSLLNVACNRTLKYILLDERRHPSEFVKFVLEFNSVLTLVILLLKIVLIFPNIRLYLENHIAELIKFYSACEEEECRVFIDFLDVLNVTLAIFDEDTDYSLIKMNKNDTDQDLCDPDLNDYRVFSQSKKTVDLKKDISLEEETN
jgi:hypothetical protein